MPTGILPPKVKVSFSRATILETGVNHLESGRRVAFRIGPAVLPPETRLLPGAAEAERSPTKRSEAEAAPHRA